MSDYAKPLPVIDETNAQYWEGTRIGELRVQKCDDCGALAYPPSRYCSVCLSERRSWVPVSGRGTISSYVVFHRPYFPSFEPELPYNVILVQLDEGPKLYSNCVGVPNEDLRIGMKVKANFEPVTEDVTLVKFEPA